MGDQKYDSGRAMVHVPIKFQLPTPATMPMNVHIFASSQNDYPSSLTVIQAVMAGKLPQRVPPSSTW
ncbi:MAG: hypothetical protein JOZ31_20735 [Verrucomicrobia bacterium]|nr:hypothetical protein [Verrucomicrobiota bacterium]MBV8481975.1 hypothetical protein [Verrucomicrobiota bacterium]